MRNINNSDNRINVDSRNYSTIARFRQEDDATLIVNLFKNGSEFDVSNQTITLRALRVDGQSINQTDNITKNKNIVTINFRRNILNVIGRCSIQLNISDASGQFTTAEFFIEVEKNNLGSDALKGSDNVQALQQILIDFKAEKSSLIKNITDDYNSLKKIIIDQNQAANLQNQINQNKQQLVENTTRIEQLEDLTPVWQEHECVGNVTVNDSFDGISKDLVIRGRTIYNLKKLAIPLVSGGTLSNVNDIYKVTSTGEAYSCYMNFPFENKFLLKPSTTYTLVTSGYNVSSNANNKDVTIHDRTAAVTMKFEKVDKNIFKITTPSNFNCNNDIRLLFYCGTVSGATVEVSNKLIFLEGDWANKPLPFNSYFDSITSSGEQEDNKIKIKSVGKNLCDKNDFYKQLYEADTSSSKQAITRVVEDGRNCFKIMQNGSIKQAYRNKFKPNTAYTISFFCKQKSANNSALVIKYTDGSQIILYAEPSMSVFKKFSVTTSPNKQIDYISPFWSDGKELFIDEDTIQIEEDTKATNYEQYRSKLIEIPLPFQKGLKSTLNGSVYDEINGNTGEIIQRVSDEYTALAKPIIHKITDVQLNTFDETTHITQENNILSDISFKAKVSLSSQAKRLSEENKVLKEENRELREDTNVIVDSLISFFGPMLLPAADDVGGDQKIILEKLYQIKNR